MHFTKFFFIKLLFLTLFSLKVTAVVADNFSDVISTEIIKTSPGESEKEAEKEQENEKFQEINQKVFPYLSFNQIKKEPTFKNLILYKILTLEFKTPPPENLL